METRPLPKHNIVHSLFLKTLS